MTPVTQTSVATSIDPTSLAVVQSSLKLTDEPKFPDMSANYRQTILVPEERAAAAAQAAREAAQQAQAARVVQYAPPVYMAPQDSYKAFVYNYESGNNPAAVNHSSGACGLGQALPCSKLPCSLSDYACQDNFFTSYMLNRYGSWQNAYYHELSYGWW